VDAPLADHGHRLRPPSAATGVGRLAGMPTAPYPFAAMARCFGWTAAA
jgi:hypothetical protein